MKTIKNTRTIKQAMTAEELKRLRLEMNYDKVGLAELLQCPYRTLQDYEAGKRGIPAVFSDKMRAAHKYDRQYMAGMVKRLDKELDHLYPFGIMSEKINNDDE